VNSYILRAMLGIMILRRWMMTLIEVYQEEELPPSFIVDPGAGLDDLVGDVDDIEMPIVKPVVK
jgi:hypothetical protein